MSLLTQAEYYYNKFYNTYLFKKYGGLLHSKDIKNYNTPFFIVGSGRCGTTLLRVQLEKDQNICIPPESGISFEKSVHFFLQNHNLIKKDWKEIVNSIFKIYEQDSNWNYWNTVLNKENNEIFEIDFNHRSLNTIVNYIYGAYLKNNKPDAKIWGDKNPYMVFNLNYVLKTFPNARIINLIRDGRDVVASWYVSKLKYQNLEDICNRWNWSIKEAEKFQKLYPGKIIFIKYEDLITNTSLSLKNIAGHINIDYNPSIDLHELFTDDLNQSHLTNSKGNITKDRIMNWKNVLSEKEIQKIVPIIKDNLMKYNYLPGDE